MTFYIIAAILNAVTSTICFITILFTKDKNKTISSFLWFAFFVCAWSTSYVFWILSNTYQNSIFFTKLVNMFAFYIPHTFFIFCCHLLKKEEKFRRFNTLLLIFNIAFLPITLSSLYINKLESIGTFNFHPRNGPLYIVFIIEYLILVSISFIQIQQKINKSKDKNEIKMLRFVFYGLGVAFLGGATNLPYVFNIKFPPVGNILVSLYTFGITYGILKYQFMEISIIIRKSIIYTLLISFISISYLVAIYFTEHALQSMLRYQSFILSISFATAIALLFTPLKNFFQNIVENHLFKGSIPEISEENNLLRQEIIQTEKFKAVAKLASGIAHEIKNPLTTLQTFSEYLPSKINDPAFVNTYLTLIPKEINRINALVQDLLAFSKPSQPQFEIIDPDQVINEVMSLTSLHAREIQIKTHFEKIPTSIKADPNQLKQALLNIIMNAIDAMPNGGTLVIASEAKQSTYTITISDTGYGIAQQDIKHIFEPFFTKKHKGTGLGLSITKDIIEKHGGRITVESKLNKGTTFSINLEQKYAS